MARTVSGLRHNMDKILLLGVNGQVGWELSRSLLPLGDVTALSRSECDLANKDELVSKIRTLRPSIIVNAAAYTNVDKAEADQETAMCINAEAPAILAEEAKRLDALLVDYSTDYVFDGTKSDAYLESDIAHPVNVYGRSKLAGLQAIQQSGCRFLVFRVGWVYGRHGNNFVKTMLRLGQEKEELSIVSDQIGSPASADLIADVSAQTISLNRSSGGIEGVFNLVPTGTTSWYGFADVLFNYAAQISDFKQPKLIPIKSNEYITPAKRPANSCLNIEKLQNVLGLNLPAWQVPLKRILDEIVRR